MFIYIYIYIIDVFFLLIFTCLQRLIVSIQFCLMDDPDGGFEDERSSVDDRYHYLKVVPVPKSNNEWEK